MRIKECRNVTEEMNRVILAAAAAVVVDKTFSLCGGLVEKKEAAPIGREARSKSRVSSSSSWFIRLLFLGPFISFLLFLPSFSTLDIL